MRKKNVLVITVNPWNDEGILNTMQNLFSGYDPEKIYSLYLRSDLPNTVYCNHSYQIREVQLYKSLFKSSIQIGQEVKSNNIQSTQEEKQEGSFKKIYHNLNFKSVLLLRELIWKTDKWKEAQLDNYLKKANPDVIFATISSYLYTNRVVSYVKSKFPNAELVLFFVDDNYTYQAVAPMPLSLLHRFLLRRLIRRLVDQASYLFAISPKMKKEYESYFGKKFTILTKSVSVNNNIEQEASTSSTLNMIYVGNLLYGRLQTLKLLSKAIEEINLISHKKIKLSVYTQTELKEGDASFFNQRKFVKIYPPVPYSKAKELQAHADILLYVESFIKKYYRVARLSFSTKITDYLGMGKLVVAIGPKDIAPIEYLDENKAALVISEQDKICKQLRDILTDPKQIETIRKNSRRCCEFYHSNKRNSDILYSLLNS